MRGPRTGVTIAVGVVFAAGIGLAALLAVGAAPPATKPATEPAAVPAAPPPPAEPTLVLGLSEGFPRVRYPDGSVSLNDRCIVRGNRLNVEVHPVYVNDLPIAFCCTGCPAVFSSDPEPWLEKQKIRVQCPVERARPATLSRATRCFVGHDVFYFSGPGALARFKRAPLRYCGTLTDPVTLERFQPGATSPHLARAGRDYYFTTAATRARFVARPDSFAVRQGA